MIDVVRDLLCSRWMLFGAFALALTGCSDSEEPEALLTFRVIDAESQLPVASAQVDASGSSALSDASGELSVAFNGELRVAAEGYLPLSLLADLDASSGPVVLPLTPSSPRQRTVRGVVAGWDSLPEMPSGKYRMVRVEAAQVNDASRIQRWLSLQTSGAVCVTRGAPAPCAFELNASQGARAVFAVVVEGDDAGTPEDFSDDQLDGVGFGLLPIEPGAELLSDQVLGLLPQDQQFSVSVKPSAGGGTVASEPVGVPGVALGDQVLVFPPFAGDLSAYRVPLGSVQVGSQALSASTLWGISISVEQDTSALVVTRGAELGPEADDLRSLSTGDALAPLALTAQAGEYAVPVPSGGLVLAERDGEQWLSIKALSVPAPKISGWIQVCEPQALSTDLAQGLAKAERCVAQRLQP